MSGQRAPVADAAARSASNRVLAAGGLEYIANLDPEAGTTTLLVEAEDTPGGGARTSEVTLPGFLHDVCSIVHPLALSSNEAVGKKAQAPSPSTRQSSRPGVASKSVGVMGWLAST